MRIYKLATHDGNYTVYRDSEVVRCLMLRNPDPYPLAVAIDIAAEMDDPAGELAQLLSAHNVDLWRGPLREDSRSQRRSGCR